MQAVLAIQAACPEIAQWTAWDYDRVARGEMAGWIAEDGPLRSGSSAGAQAGTTTGTSTGTVAGFLVARRVLTDLEILNFAVTPRSRHLGNGALLLQEALAWAKNFEATRAILEVRASNRAALSFYERHKFEVVGRRPRYYTAPVEDALLLTAPIH